MTTYTYRELQSELKMFRDEMGYELEVKLTARADELAMEWDRITDLIEESDMYDEIEDEIDDETETNETLELVETTDYKGTEIRIYHHDKGYIFEIETRKEIYQTPRSTRDEALVDAKYYADKYIIRDGSNDIISDDVNEFYAEFVVNADGDYVHPKGLNYIEWLEAKNTSHYTESQSVDEIDTLSDLEDELVITQEFLGSEIKIFWEPGSDSYYYTIDGELGAKGYPYALDAEEEAKEVLRANFDIETQAVALTCKVFKNINQFGNEAKELIHHTRLCKELINSAAEQLEIELSAELRSVVEYKLKEGFPAFLDLR